MNTALIVILSAVTLDAVGIGLVFPILPGLLRDITQSDNIAVVFGLLVALYALMQFLFSPVLGLLSDRYGRRPVLLVSLAGAAIDYLVMAFAPELWVLVIGRAVAGLTSANMAVATAYIADISPEEIRAKRFGYLNACFGIGFILGPILGGLLGEMSVRYPFLLAAVLNGANFALALFFLPESRKGVKSSFNLRELNPFGALLWALTFKALLPLMAIYLLFNFMGQVYGTVWVLYSEDRFGLSTFMIGVTLACFGLFHAGAQAFATGPVTARFGERNALLIGMAFEWTACVVLAFATQLWVFFLLLPAFALGGVGMPALQSLLSRQVDESKQGQLQGVLASLVSIASIFGPLFYGSVYFWSRDGFSGLVWLITAGIYLLCLPMILGIGRTKARPEAA